MTVSHSSVTVQEFFRTERHEIGYRRTADFEKRVSLAMIMKEKYKNYVRLPFLLFFNQRRIRASLNINSPEIKIDVQVSKYRTKVPVRYVTDPGRIQDGLASIGSSVTGPVIGNGVPWTHICILASPVKNSLTGIVPENIIFEEV